jgi:hypothetical protein
MQPDRDLERELRELGSHVEYPPTPDLARTVRGRLDEGEELAPRRFRLPLPALKWAAAAAVVLIAATPALSPAMRDTVAGWFEGGRQAAGGAGEASPAGGESQASQGGPDSKATPMAAEGGSPADSIRPGSGGSAMPSSGGGSRPSGGNLGYGERIPLRDAQTRLAGSELLLPETLGAPDQVYAGGSSRNGGVVLVYRANSGLPSLGGTGVGLVLTEVPGSVESAYLRGGTLAVAGIEEVSVGSGRGYWVPAGRRPPSPTDRAGDLPGNVLFWEREGLALRLGADLPKREMIRIAESVR